MTAKTPPPLEPATSADAPAIVALMNHAYRGPAAERTWNSEGGYIGGQRIDADMLLEDMAKPGAAMLLQRDADGTITGCVWLEPKRDGVWYLGSLTIPPENQNKGAGRKLLAAAEDWARGARAIRMTVISIRLPLIAWYERRGYHLTGETAPFPYGDERFGVPQRDDLEFVVMEKDLVGDKAATSPPRNGEGDRDA